MRAARKYISLQCLILLLFHDRYKTDNNRPLEVQLKTFHLAPKDSCSLQSNCFPCYTEGSVAFQEEIDRSAEYCTCANNSLK